MLLFIATALTTPAQHFDRPLIVSWFILQFALLYRGIRTAVVTAAAISVMYVGLLLLATYAGFTLAWGQELWTLLLFIAAVLGILALQGGVTRRLERLAYLFGRMAAGDFSERYDDGTRSEERRVGKDGS